MNTSNTQTTKYIAYYRVSTREQGDSGLGLEAQKSYIEHFYSPANIIASYTDVASGKDVHNRPELAKAIKQANETGATLVVAKIDRLSRRTEQALEILETLNGRLASCDIPNLDKFTFTIFMAIADRERELISIRTKQALAAKKAQGARLGKAENFNNEGRAKGSDAMKAKANANGNNKIAADYIKMMVSAGLSWNLIAKKLNDQGYKTPRGKQFQAIQAQRIYNRYFDA